MQRYPNAPNPKHIVVSRWGKDPLALGARSYLACEAFASDFQVMAMPVADLLFAGEATSCGPRGTLLGAYSSGIREANRLIGSQF
jgi:polyamine oxidase